MFRITSAKAMSFKNFDALGLAFFRKYDYNHRIVRLHMPSELGAA